MNEIETTPADELFNVDATDTDIAPEIMVARDAFEARRPDAYKLLVGLPVTIGIGSDSYAHTIVKATRCTIACDDGRTYRRNKWGRWCSRSFRLSVGVGVEHRCREF